MFTSGASVGVLEGGRAKGLVVGGPAAEVDCVLGFSDWLTDAWRFN